MQTFLDRRTFRFTRSASTGATDGHFAFAIVRTRASAFVALHRALMPTRQKLWTGVSATEHAAPSVLVASIPFDAGDVLLVQPAMTGPSEHLATRDARCWMTGFEARMVAV